MPDAQHLRARARPGRIRFGIDHARAPVVVVTMADGSDDAEQIDELRKLVERGVVVAAASRYMSGGQQVGGPVVEELAVAARRAVALLVRPGRHPRRHQLVQGLLDATSSARSASSPTPASRSASSWWPRPAGSGCRSPRSPRSGSTAAHGQSNFKVCAWLPRYLRWYRFAFGPQLTLEQLRHEPSTRRDRP